MAPHVVKWGILATGWISSEFAKDLTLPVEKRTSEDISHAIVAVGSRSPDKADDFIKKYCPKGGYAQIRGLRDLIPKGYSTYEDAVYVGSPHQAHYEDCKLVLAAGKHCLLEKPATLNAAEWDHLCKLAKTKNLFLMEAVWTRFNPCTLSIQKAVFDGEIGDIQCVISDLSFTHYNKSDPSHRVLNPLLAGGALLDLGPYPTAMMMLYRHPKNKRRPFELVGNTMVMGKTGCDIATTWTLGFSNLDAVHQTSYRIHPRLVTRGSSELLGRRLDDAANSSEIQVQGFASRPRGYVIRKLADPKAFDSKFSKEEEVHEMDFEGYGLFWQADAVARCLRGIVHNAHWLSVDGKLECEDCPQDETAMIMKMFDKIRQDGGYDWPEGLEKIKA